MTVKEKREEIERYCRDRANCNGCRLDKVSYPFTACYRESIEDNEIERFHSILFPEFLEKELNISSIDPVNRPAHYTDGKIEVIDFIEDKKLGFCLGNVVKYVARAGKKDPEKEIEDLKKAKWYLERRIKELEEGE